MKQQIVDMYMYNVLDSVVDDPDHDGRKISTSLMIAQVTEQHVHEQRNPQSTIVTN